MVQFGIVAQIALPTVLILSLIEAWVLTARKPGSYDWRAMSVSIFDLIGRQLTILIPYSIATPFIALAWEHRIGTVDLSLASSVILLFFGVEFCYYWFHRAAHRVRWFWLSHAIHHSPNELNLSAAYRLGLTGRLTGTLLFFVPLVWWGVDPKVVFTVFALNLLYQFWIHATWIPKLGWLEWFLNTPSAHRVHHAANLEYLDGNYGGVLIVFDRLFGTYIEERADVPCRYGWVNPITTYNPLKLEVTPWLSLVQDLRSARSVGDVLGFIFGPPGWRPNGQGDTTENLRARAQSSSQKVTL